MKYKNINEMNMENMNKKDVYKVLLFFQKKNLPEKMMELQNIHKWVVLEVIENGNLDILKFFISRKVPLEYISEEEVSSPENFNLIEYNNVNLLSYAARYNKVDIANFLIESGADINDGFIELPLVEAIKNSNIEMINFLFDKGADYSNISITYCLKNKPIRYDIIELLLNRGVDINTHTQSKLLVRNLETTMLEKYNGLQAEDLYKTLLFCKTLEYENLLVVNYTRKEDTPLVYSIINCDIECVKFIIEKGADVNLECSNGVLPVILPTRECINDMNKLNLLLETGADVNKKTRRNIPPLVELAKCNASLEMFKIFISEGAKLEESDELGETPLFIYAGKNNYELVNFLLEEYFEYININTQNVEGMTPLMNSVVFDDDSFEIAELLIEKGASIEIQNEDGANVLFIAVANGNLPLVKFLVESGCNINSKDSDGCTPLIEAIYLQNIDIVKFLVESGADVNNCEPDSWTPLVYAADSGKLKIFQFLVGSGADINIITEEKKTPLLVAATKDNMKIVKYLIDLGADIYAKDEDEDTIFELLSEDLSIEIKEYIESH
jgi:ankyrin repeat protein